MNFFVGFCAFFVICAEKGGSMCSVKKWFLCVFLGLAIVFGGMGTARSADTPVGVLYVDGSKLTVAVAYLDENYPSSEINSLIDLARPLIGSSVPNLYILSPAEISAIGYNAASLHTFLVTYLSGFEAYVKIDGTAVPGPSGVGGTNMRFDITVFVSPDFGSGQYIGSIEIAQSLNLSALEPLLALLGLQM
jgi:hypothetical protein